MVGVWQCVEARGLETGFVIFLELLHIQRLKKRIYGRRPPQGYPNNRSASRDLSIVGKLHCHIWTKRTPCTSLRHPRPVFTTPDTSPSVRRGTPRRRPYVVIVAFLRFVRRRRRGETVGRVVRRDTKGLGLDAPGKRRGAS